MAGMMALYTVLPGDPSIEEGVRSQLNGTTRRYFVAAEEVGTASTRGVCLIYWLLLCIDRAC